MAKATTRFRIRRPYDYDAIGISLTVAFRAICMFPNCRDTQNDLEIELYPDWREPDRQFTREEIATAIGRPVSTIEIF